MDVAGKFGEIAICFHENRFKPSLKKMAASFALYVVINRISRIEALHDPGQVGLSNFNKQMIVIAHQAISI